jgi:hypothetical protein
MLIQTHTHHTYHADPARNSGVSTTVQRVKRLPNSLPINCLSSANLRSTDSVNPWEVLSRARPRNRLYSRHRDIDVCVCLLLQYLLHICSRGGEGNGVGNVLRETTRRVLCGVVDLSAHHALVNAGEREIV